jgi:hypothetical protein
VGNIYINSNTRISLEIHRNPPFGSVSDSVTRIPIGFLRMVGSDQIRSDPVSDSSIWEQLTEEKKDGRNCLVRFFPFRTIIKQDEVKGQSESESIFMMRIILNMAVICTHVRSDVKVYYFSCLFLL